MQRTFSKPDVCNDCHKPLWDNGETIALRQVCDCDKGRVVHDTLMTNIPALRILCRSCYAEFSIIGYGNNTWRMQSYEGADLYCPYCGLKLEGKISK